jgi:hypothetical protein
MTAPGKGVAVLQAEWDESAGVAFVSHPTGLTLETLDAVAAWRDEVFSKLAVIERQRGGRFPIVVSVDGLTIRPTVAAEYGRVVREYTERFASGLARYSRRPNGVGQIIAVAAMKEGFRANLFSSRSDAIQHALAAANEGAPPKSRSGP